MDNNDDIIIDFEPIDPQIIIEEQPGENPKKENPANNETVLTETGEEKSQDIKTNQDAEICKELFTNGNNEVIKSINELSSKMDLMNKLFTDKIQYSEHEEKIVDNMHKELNKYKEDLYSKLVKPILLDTIEVRDSIMRIAETYGKKPEGETSIPNSTFIMSADEISEILEKNNIEIYRSEQGSEFIPIKHKALKKIATDKEELHGKIAESFSSGYNFDGRTLSPEKISIYFYEKTDKNI